MYNFKYIYVVFCVYNFYEYDIVFCSLLKNSCISFIKKQNKPYKYYLHKVYLDKFYDFGVQHGRRIKF